MALTRGMLKGMGLTEEQVSAIIEEHANTVDGLKADLKQYKEEAGKSADLQKEIEKLKKQMDTPDEWKGKYEKEHEDFEKYKKDVSDKENLAKIKEAYRKLLVKNNVGESHIASILRVTNLQELKLDKEGNLVNEDKLSEQIKSDYDGFIPKSGTSGAKVDNPPAGSKKTMTKDEILKIEDTSQRQAAIAENHELFGI